MKYERFYRSPPKRGNSPYQRQPHRRNQNKELRRQREMRDLRFYSFSEEEEPD